MALTLKEILHKARKLVEPPTWAGLSRYIDRKECKHREYAYAPLGAQARARAWLTGLPLRYIKHIAELTGISEQKIVAANYEAIQNSKKGK